VTSGHFIARLHFTFDRHEDFNHLHHARRQFVTALEFFNLVLETLFEVINGVIEGFGPIASISSMTLVFVIDSDLTPQATFSFHQDRLL
jgi:hypothetical protein